LLKIQITKFSAEFAVNKIPKINSLLNWISHLATAFYGFGLFTIHYTINL